MPSWVDEIALAIENLGGIASLADIYEEVRRIRPLPHPVNLGASIRGAIERNSSDSAAFSGKDDIFFSVHGIGGGVWGLRAHEKHTPKAVDITAGGNESPQKKRQETYRVLRDTKLSRQIKMLHENKCQICSESIELPNGASYSEAHHIIPLGGEHNGPDVAGNIIVLCPNHHVMLDYGVVQIDVNSIRLHQKHKISSDSIKYHNEEIFNSC